MRVHTPTLGLATIAREPRVGDLERSVAREEAASALREVVGARLAAESVEIEGHCYADVREA